eukprot:TRINITY_DN25419_c0_g1_i1.p1 TRINITY_DN25419_c0_g1~~TRINITY_DN25419_c0_g1_i1.p1  ORF type:complete len:348 (+),score=29.65 TRINITY_DN25419_c0_g1_i1:50-1093(+)
MQAASRPLLRRGSKGNGAVGGAVHPGRILARFATVVSITAVTVALVFGVMQPLPCSHVEACVAIDHDISYIYHVVASSGLSTVFLHELASYVLTYKSVRQARSLLGNVLILLQPSAILCFSFFVLFLENIVLMAKMPWYAHSTPILGGEGQPVYTIFYVEWLINVPLLLLLAGQCALERPFQEIVRPMVVTNVYITLAWACYFIESQSLQNAVVTLSFAMYAWASYDMCLWVGKFMRLNPDSQSGLYLRPFLTISLIVIFGIYGVVFLGRLHGFVSARGEKLFYTFMDIVSKLLVCMVFTGVRSSRYHSLILDMLANTNTSFRRGFNNSSQGSLVDSDPENLVEPMV